MCPPPRRIKDWRTEAGREGFTDDETERSEEGKRGRGRREEEDEMGKMSKGRREGGEGEEEDRKKRM